MAAWRSNEESACLLSEPLSLLQTTLRDDRQLDVAREGYGRKPAARLAHARNVRAGIRIVGVIRGDSSPLPAEGLRAFFPSE